MGIEVDIYEKIRYLYEHEGQSQRAISRMLGISRNTVKKYCKGTLVPWERQGVSGRHRYVITADILEFIEGCLAEDREENIKKQVHTAKRIYDRLVAEKDFTGGESTVREAVALLKDKQSKVFVPLSFEPGKAIQIDWGEATAYLDGKKTRVNIFCMRECYSADIFCTAFYRQNQESFFEAQILGFDYFSGISKRLIFDNAKVAVKEGFGAHAVMRDSYKALAAHYAFHCDENPQLRRGYWREEPIDGKESHDIIDSSDWRVAPFSTQERFQEHVSEHLKDYGDIRPIDYLNKARDLLAAPLSKDVEGFVDSEGYVFKYRISTNEFAVGRPDGKISTL